MRIFAALLLLGLASEGWAESGISGMLACNPNDKANLQAMSCEAGWSWDEQAGECVETPTS